MRNRRLSRILLFGLVAVTILLFYRIVRDDSDPRVVAELTDIGLDDLAMTAFEVEAEPAEVTIVATGSLQSDSVLAAYPWILRSSDRTLVWRMTAGSGVRDGQLLSVEEDIVVDPDRYELYFASFGDPGQPTSPPEGLLDKIIAEFDDEFAKWRSQSSKWEVSILHAHDAEGSRLQEVKLDHHYHHSDDPLLIWTSAPAKPGRRKHARGWND
jgi:hypothetical protein